VPSEPGFLRFFESRVGRVLRDHHLLQNDDSILVASICPRDGLPLLDLLHRLRRPVPPRFRLGFATTRPMGAVAAELRGDSVRAVAGAAGAEVHELTLPLGAAPGCPACREAALEQVCRLARTLGATAVALPDCLDELAEDVLHGLVVEGALPSVEPVLELPGGLRLIRPLAFSEERLVRRYARERGLAPLEAPCAPSGEASPPPLARLLAGLGAKPARLKFNLVRAARQAAVVSRARSL